MALRCFIFCADPEVKDPIGQVLAGLGIEGEEGSEAVAAVEKIGSERFDLILADWDQQPEAVFILQAARDRKPNERPLTLAIVSDDASVPKALQAGANSILRKPIQPSQAKDTLTTARDMVRARESAGKSMQAAAGAAVSAPAPASSYEDFLEGEEKEGEEEKAPPVGFVQHSASSTTTLFEAESKMQASVDQPAARDVGPLKNLEPVASSVAREQPIAPPAPASGEPRGLQWYLNQRAAAAPPPPAQAPPPPADSAKADLLGYDQAPSEWKPAPTNSAPAETNATSEQQERREQKVEAELFAYIESDKPKKKEPRQPIRLGKGPITVALVLAACAIIAAPQAPWHPQMRGLWGRGQKTLHAWLNPQLVTPATAPASHENFGRAGDEYKLPVAEAIPDATTDPSQIRVTPMVDPTKKPNSNGTAADPNLLPPPGNGDGVINVAPANPADGTQAPAGQTPATPGQAPDAGNSTQSSPSAPGNAAPAQPAASQSPTQTAPQTANSAPATPAPAPVVTANAGPPHPDPFTATASAVPAVAQPPAPRSSQPVSAPSGPPIPSSLKSQMASMTPEASGNKAPETALPSIEPVNVPESAERALITDQPALVYPASAKTQTGTVVLQVLVGRDGTVEDAKFLQGSLAFARAAIDGVKQWKFKPYIMNGRPVSVQTNLTIGFRPGQ